MILVCALAIGSSPQAAAFGGGFSPGRIDGSSSFGFAQGFDFNANVNVFVQLQTGFSTFRPHRPGGPLITIQANFLNAGFDGPGAFGFGCWLFPSSDLVVNSDLGATLTFDSSDPAVTECPGDPVGNPVLGAPPTVGPSGLVVGLNGPVQLHVTWVTAGPVVSSHTTTRISCKPFMSLDEGTSKNAESTTAGSASAAFDATGPFAAQFAGGVGNITVSSGQINITGPPNAGCGPF